MKTLIIAEAGVNHNGDMNLARRLIDAAADGGADIVKFQTFNAANLATAAAAKAEYQNRTTDPVESQLSMLRRLELTPEMHKELMSHAASRGIEFFSTAFDLDSVDLLVELGLRRFKIPSGEITNLPYLRKIGHVAGEIIISTGMATLGEVKAAIAALEGAGASRNRITILHCTTEYPAPMSDVNLRAMITMRDELGLPVGYSDHTAGIEVSIAAVALGAVVIEKHITIDRSLPGPDHKASLEPAELRSLVIAVRNIERALGDGTKGPSDSERKNMPIARKSLVAARPIRSGEIFDESNLAVKRPGTGISPMQWDEIVGTKADRDYARDEIIER